MGSCCSHCNEKSKEADINASLFVVIPQERVRTKSTKKENTQFNSGLKDLELKPTKFYVDKIGLSTADFVKSRRRYLELGQYDYQGETYTEDFGDKIDISFNGTKYYYVGQFRKGTSKRDGIGMTVGEDGYMHEGYYKNDKCNGPGRIIKTNGDYLVCDFVDSYACGYGEYYFSDGSTYKGQWKNGYWNGEGTFVDSEGNKDVGVFKDGEIDI